MYPGYQNFTLFYQSRIRQVPHQAFVELQIGCEMNWHRPLYATVSSAGLFIVLLPLLAPGTGRVTSRAIAGRHSGWTVISR